jgi:glutathione S-transferase
MTPAQNSSNEATIAGTIAGTIVIRRTIPATVDELFDAWLDPDSLAQWMHPGSTVRSTASVDARVGGAFEVVMHTPDKPLRHHGEYRHIERNKKLAFTWISDATQHTETLVTVEFKIAANGTEIVLTHERMPGHEAGKAHAQGWTLAFDLLADLVAPKPLVLTTFDWVPEMPRGFVRDIRVRWALEEAGLPYRVRSVPFSDRNADHFSHQPFGQVPWLSDGDLSIFETGAILLHLGERSTALLPAAPRGRAETVEWLFAALNSVEMASLPWALMHFSGNNDGSPGWNMMDSFLKKSRLPHLEPVLAEREWLAGPFSIADILMADVLRLVDRFDGLADCPACRAYVARATARPAFIKAHADQMAHFAAADAGMTAR